MNRTEAAWGGVLQGRLLAGQIAAYWFEGIKLRLGLNLWYTPDFLVQLADGTVEVHEVKATWRGKNWAGKAGFREDARVKIKAAAHQFPLLRFVVVRLDGSEWHSEEIKPHA